MNYQHEMFLDKYVGSSAVKQSLLNKPDDYKEIQDPPRNTKLSAEQRALIRKTRRDNHEIFVRECLRPRGYENGEGFVFAKIHPLEAVEPDTGDASPYNEYYVELLTPAMAYVDYQYFLELRDGSPRNPLFSKLSVLLKSFAPADHENFRAFHVPSKSPVYAVLCGLMTK